jgi:hypothetical protein
VARFKVGDIVEMNGNAIENYGEEWAGIPLVVDHVATDYMPASKFYAMGNPNGYHPGYDSAANGEGLYDLSVVDGDPLAFSLYDFELERG